jgi:hypothetical protein
MGYQYVHRPVKMIPPNDRLHDQCQLLMFPSHRNTSIKVSGLQPNNIKDQTICEVEKYDFENEELW